MSQIIAIYVLTVWVGWAVYLYRVDPGNERFWTGNKKSFLVEVLLESTALTFFTSALTIVIGGLLALAFGVIE